MLPNPPLYISLLTKSVETNLHEIVLDVFQTLQLSRQDVRELLRTVFGLNIKESDFLQQLKRRTRRLSHDSDCMHLTMTASNIPHLGDSKCSQLLSSTPSPRPSFSVFHWIAIVEWNCTQLLEIQRVHKVHWNLGSRTKSHVSRGMSFCSSHQLQHYQRPSTYQRAREPHANRRYIFVGMQHPVNQLIPSEGRHVSSDCLKSLVNNACIVRCTHYKTVPTASVWYPNETLML